MTRCVELRTTLGSRAAAEELADAMVDLLARPDTWPAIRSAARQFVEAERNWGVSVGRYRDVYGPLIGLPAVAAVV